MFINLTPHEIHLPNQVIPPDGRVARCKELSLPIFGHRDGAESVELIFRAYGYIVDLPEPIECVIFIVSAMVRMAWPGRKDLASPGDLVRDEKGNIVGCLNLVVNP